MLSNNKLLIGLVDADLIGKGTRHPNLVLLKIAGFLSDNHIPFELIVDPDASIDKFSRIYVSKVFSFTDDPGFLKLAKTQMSDEEFENLFCLGGTGFYSIDTPKQEFASNRSKDMARLEDDPYLNTLQNHRGGDKLYGIDMARQMPYYDLYLPYIKDQIDNHGKTESFFKDYLYYSIGFLTRGCVRHCPFCINKLENKVNPYSELDWFVDDRKDPETGKYLRPYIYLWDDNFLASERDIWEPKLLELKKKGMPFQFRQGLDERMLAEKGEEGEEMAKLLTSCNYHGDYIFAFDNWSDRVKIESALKIWNKYNVKKHPTKFYLFCGFKQENNNTNKFYKDIWQLFHRIRILMHYGCLGYVMRHADSKSAPIPNFYVQIARWCNQPAFYKKMSFWEFCYRNQSYWEEQRGFEVKEKLISYEEYVQRKDLGFYEKRGLKICLPLRTIDSIFDMFPEHKEIILKMFNYKFVDIQNETNWDPDPEIDRV